MTRDRWITVVAAILMAIAIYALFGRLVGVVE